MINQHDMDYLPDDDDDEYDIDSDIGTIIANAHDTKRSIPRIPPNQWFTISPDGRKKWQDISEEDRAAILSVKESKQLQQKKNHDALQSSKHIRKAKLHDIFNTDLIDINFHDAAQDLSDHEENDDIPDENVHSDDISPNDDQPILAHVTKHL
jgi:hypothetical protein